MKDPDIPKNALNNTALHKCGCFQFQLCTRLWIFVMWSGMILLSCIIIRHPHLLASRTMNNNIYLIPDIYACILCTITGDYVISLPQKGLNPHSAIFFKLGNFNIEIMINVGRVFNIYGNSKTDIPIFPYQTIWPQRSDTRNNCGCR